MGSGLGSIFGPGPTKPKKVIAMQQESNLKDAALMQSQRPDQFGTGFQQQWTTDSSGRPVQTTSLSPDNQFLYQQAQGNRAGLGAGVGGLIGNYAGQLMQPLDLTGSAMGATLGGAGVLNQLLAPFQQRQTEEQDTAMRNQGLVPGGKAFDRSQTKLRQDQALQYMAGIFPLQNQIAGQINQSDQGNIHRLNTLFPMTGPSFPIQPQNLTGYNPGQTNVGAITENYDKQNQARADAIGKLIANVAMGGMGLPFGGGTLGSSMGASLLGNGIGNFFSMTPSPYYSGQGWHPPMA